MFAFYDHVKCLLSKLNSCNQELNRGTSTWMHFIHTVLPKIYSYMLL